MYRRCAIIASGSAVIAVVCLNSTCYGGGGKNNVVSSYTGTGQAAEDEEQDEDTDEETGVFTSLINSDMTLENESSVKPLLDLSLEDNILKYRCVYVDVNEVQEAQEALVSADYINPIITITDEE